MDGLNKILAVLTLSTIVLALAAPALAQLPGHMQGGTKALMEQSNNDMMATMTGMKDISIATSTMKTAGIEGITKPGGTYTLFIASDQALKATSPDMMNRMKEKVKDRQVAIDFVKGHMINGMVMPDDMTDGKKLTMMNGITMTIRKMDGRTMVDDANIIKAVKTNNGMVYVMDKIPSSIMDMIKQMGMMPKSDIPISR